MTFLSRPCLAENGSNGELAKVAHAHSQVSQHFTSVYFLTQVSHLKAQVTHFKAWSGSCTIKMVWACWLWVVLTIVQFITGEQDHAKMFTSGIQSFHFLNRVCRSNELVRKAVIKWQKNTFVCHLSDRHSSENIQICLDYFFFVSHSERAVSFW